MTQTCPKCSGSGKSLTQCTQCKGRAFYTKQERVLVQIPPGISPLTSLRLSGKGNEVYQFGNERKAGNTFVVIDYPVTQNGVRLDSGNIYASVHIPFNAILAEETITVDILGCKDIQLKLDSNKKSGHQYKVKSAGITKKQHAFIQVFIDSAENKLSDEDRQKLIKVMVEVYGMPNTRYGTTDH